ncbi:hypothetical protein E3N88_34548 [Mikania micrantha]|uniref:Uncharacterized protein n=1 Tax=Mikania micrantha TaxID=192012 RepID=A0A5N6LYK7_9ASTR|nr:hypothetical protein E3N88_34548 [Mikania micrantha]
MLDDHSSKFPCVSSFVWSIKSSFLGVLEIYFVFLRESVFPAKGKAIEEGNAFLPHRMPSYSLGLTQEWAENKADIRPGAIWLQQVIILLQEVVAKSWNLRRH